MRSMRSIVETAKKHWYITAIGAALLAAVAGAVWYVRQQRILRRQHASEALLECLTERARAVSNQVPWSDVALAAERGYEMYGDVATVAPYFLVTQAHALARMGDAEKALTLYAKVEQSIAPDNPFYASYGIQYAQVLIANGKQESVAKGLAMLENFANKDGAMMQDAALYYLGQYYASQNDKKRAQELWDKLVILFPSAGESVGSPFAELVKGGL